MACTSRASLQRSPARVRFLYLLSCLFARPIAAVEGGSIGSGIILFSVFVKVGNA